MHQLGNLRVLKDVLHFGEPLGAPLPPERRVCNFIIPKAIWPFSKAIGYCRILTKKSYLVMKKTSRLHEMVFQPG